MNAFFHNPHSRTLTINLRVLGKMAVRLSLSFLYASAGLERPVYGRNVQGNGRVIVPQETIP